MEVIHGGQISEWRGLRDVRSSEWIPAVFQFQGFGHIQSPALPLERYTFQTQGGEFQAQISGQNFRTEAGRFHAPSP